MILAIFCTRVQRRAGHLPGAHRAPRTPSPRLPSNPGAVAYVSASELPRVLQIKGVARFAASNLMRQTASAHLLIEREGGGLSDGLDACDVGG